MGIFETVVLALLQGITEFLPISSSAHLILPSQMFGWPDQGLAFDVAVHFGTLLAVVAYFRKDLQNMIVGWLTTGFTRTPNDDARLSWMVAIATVPAVVFGLLGEHFIEDNLRSTAVIATTTIIFGIVLGLSDRATVRHNNLAQMTLTLALVIGFAQAMALIPGTSRSGITMTAALFLGFNRVDSARFSFLLSVPLILAAAGLKTLELLQNMDGVDWSMLFLGLAVSGISAWLVISFFLEFIGRIGMLPFVIYRLFLGVVLFAFFV
ncbi:undecaprenyl-diphosphate phosphatase [Parathalassolituus penaei]|uniref:Undecaprenyl-diphosphatase n=1 Tax=Parathalassolituus penaei TaxID=2997323 RepID=A0A9X3EKD9_9GAMM|nr:undecaprenyl-diphosphate phosphatase [Parathalassolituus penaei]MCY0965926.1 undecaprenyl-diphosphate phosphatase [Parathalassolituus penaei]